MTTIAIPGVFIAIAGAALLALVVGAVIALVPPVHLHHASAETDSGEGHGADAAVRPLRTDTSTSGLDDGAGRRDSHPIAA
jgi:hypothetical protein